MATPQQLGTLETLSAPCLHDGMIWFQGTDNKLMAMPMDDPSKAFNVEGLKTLSEPVPVANRYMCFRGEGDKLMLVTTDPPYLHGQVGAAKCLSAPVPCGPYLYFQGTGNSLSRCRHDRDLQEPILVDGQPVTGCTDRPAISDAHPDRLFYTAGEEVAPTTLGHSVLHCVDLKSGGNTVSMPSNASNLYASPDGNFWCIHFGNLATLTAYPHWEYRRFAAHADPVRPCLTPYNADVFIYYVFGGDLYRIDKKSWDTDVNRTLLAHGCATSPDVQPGFVIYGGADKKIYKLAL